MKQVLNVSLENLRLECVLMQAWKKTSSYLRTHNWYADTLDIDYQVEEGVTPLLESVEPH